MRLFGYDVRLNRQWWWYEVRKGSIHQRTYLKKSDAMGFASVSQKIGGGFWIVRRKTKRGGRIIARFDGVRYE